MLRFRRMQSLQKFASVHASVFNHFNQERSLYSRAEGKDYILFAPWISLFPGLFIMISALSVTLIGRGIQKRMDN